MASHTRYITIGIDVSFNTTEKEDGTLEFSNIVCIATSGEHKNIDVTIIPDTEQQLFTVLCFHAQIKTISLDNFKYSIAVCGTKIAQRSKLLENNIRMTLTLIGSYETKNTPIIDKNTFNDERDDKINMLAKEVERLNHVIQILVTPSKESKILEHNDKAREKIWQKAHPIEVYDDLTILATAMSVPVAKVNNINANNSVKRTIIIPPKRQYKSTIVKHALSNSVIRTFEASDKPVSVTSNALDTLATVATSSSAPIDDFMGAKKRKLN